jgi:hypothetical protein
LGSDFRSANVIEPHRLLVRREQLAQPALGPQALAEQRRFVLWWDEREKHPGGRPTENPSQTADRFRVEDFGLDCDTIYRWHKRLKDLSPR